MKENFNLNDNTTQSTTGGLRKIKDYSINEPSICNSPSHNPPMFIYLTPGLYEWTCPACGAITTFEVPLITF